jgi:hypothetical protein
MAIVSTRHPACGVAPVQIATANDGDLMKILVGAAAAFITAGAISGCSRDVSAMTPQSIEQQYGLSGAYADTVATTDGSLKGMTVPVTLADGRAATLFIPAAQANQPHAVYLRDADGLHPVAIKEHATRDEIARSPAVVEKQAEPPHADKRSWEKEAMIIGGSAGAGTVIGAVAGGKKGAAIGAAAGGVGGLIYDVITRDKK